MRFADRYDAGRRLAVPLQKFAGDRPVVIGLARGGVVVAGEVARALRAPLDALIVRKLGAPGAAEFAIGALAPGVVVLDDWALIQLAVPESYLEAAIERERQEMERREARYRRHRAAPPVEGRTVIAVDDGLATGATARAAVRSLRARQAARVVFAAPVCSAEGRDLLALEADEVVCLYSPVQMQAVGFWYQDFSPTSDEEVLACLEGSA